MKFDLLCLQIQSLSITHVANFDESSKIVQASNCVFIAVVYTDRNVHKHLFNRENKKKKTENNRNVYVSILDSRQNNHNSSQF